MIIHKNAEIYLLTTSIAFLNAAPSMIYFHLFQFYLDFL